MSASSKTDRLRRFVAVAPAPTPLSATDAERAGQPVMQAGLCFGLTVAVLVSVSVARRVGVAGPTLLSESLFTAAIALIAWRTRVTFRDLGLQRAHIRSGLQWGLGVFGVVLLALLIGLVLPITNGFLHDSRGDISGSRLIYELGVSILLLTAIPEEFAFRGVLLGSATTMWGQWRASLITSGLFGLWHIEPTLSSMSHNNAVSGASGSVIGQTLVVLGAVAVTFVAGLAFCWLRLRSKSLLAPILAHLATNGIALIAAWIAVR